MNTDWQTSVHGRIQMRPKQGFESDADVERSVVVTVVVDCALFVLTTAQSTHGKPFRSFCFLFGLRSPQHLCATGEVDFFARTTQ